MAHQPLIFVSIASYRDPQLIPTIQDALAKAARPENLRFGICWQHSDDHGALPFASDPRFRILDVDWRESRGCCWARAESQKLYDDESWYLQLDAHHRFAPNWDRTLLATAVRTGSDKPILTGLTPGFKPHDPNSFECEPKQTDFRQFSIDGTVESFQSTAIAGWRDRRDPIRARFVTAGFIFAPGSFVADVPYDSELMFWGEEITLSVRAYTCGYDFFTPTEIVLWHFYVENFDSGAEAAAKHSHNYYVDHPECGPQDRSATERVRRFLREPFDCGTVRTLADYEQYAGLSFNDRAVSSHTMRKLEPPNPPLPDGWADRRYNIEITFNPAKLPIEFTRLWFSARDADEFEVYGEVIEANELRLNHLTYAPVGRIGFEFASEHEPFYWTLMAFQGGRWHRLFYGTAHSGTRARGIHLEAVEQAHATAMASDVAVGT